MVVVVAVVILKKNLCLLVLSSPASTSSTTSVFEFADREKMSDSVTRETWTVRGEGAHRGSITADSGSFIIIYYTNLFK